MNERDANATAVDPATRRRPGDVLPPSLLLVDDDAVLRERLARAFRHRGWEVRTAANCDEATASAEAEPPEYALVDLRMPRCTGIELMERLLAVDTTTRICVLTGYGSIATAVEAVRRGAVNYLQKPADADEVIAALEAPPGDAAAGDEASIQTPSLARVEWEHIQRVLNDCSGNVSEASRRLGIHRRSLQRKLQKFAPD